MRRNWNLHLKPEHHKIIAMWETLKMSIVRRYSVRKISKRLWWDLSRDEMNLSPFSQTTNSSWSLSWIWSKFQTSSFSFWFQNRIWQLWTGKDLFSSLPPIRKKSKCEGRVGDVEGDLVSGKTENNLVETASRKAQNEKPLWEPRQ